MTLSPEERAKRLLEHLFDDFSGWPEWWLEDIATAIREAVEEYRSKADAYDACVSVARSRVDNIPAHLEAQIPQLCGITREAWLRHKERFAIGAVDMLEYAKREAAVKEAKAGALDRAAHAVTAAARPRDLARITAGDQLRMQAAAFFSDTILGLKDPTP